MTDVAAPEFHMDAQPVTLAPTLVHARGSEKLGKACMLSDKAYFHDLVQGVDRVFATSHKL